MAGTRDVTGHEVIQADKFVLFGSRVAYNMHQTDPDVIPTLDVYGGFSNAPQEGNAIGIQTDSASKMIAVNIHEGGQMYVRGRTASAIGVFASCPITFVNEGRVEVSSMHPAATGFVSLGRGFDLTNSGSIQVHSDSGPAKGLELDGNEARVVNSGTISAGGSTDEGLISRGDGLSFINTGSLVSGEAVEIYGSGSSIDNQGSIIGGTGGKTPGYGIEVLGGDDVHISNAGTISGDFAVFEGEGSASQITLDNSGALNGSVVLGAGADVVTNSGVVRKPVHLGGGDDVFAMSGHGHVHGGVYGGDGADSLTGARADDQLIGAKGADVLDGGLGADNLSGGADGDVFVFHSVKDSDAAHTDLITDLDGSDLIDLSDVDADRTVKGDQAFTLVGALDGHAGELAVSYDAGSGLTTVAGDVDGDGTADLVIHLSGDQTAFSGYQL